VPIWLSFSDVPVAFVGVMVTPAVAVPRPIVWLPPWLVVLYCPSMSRYALLTSVARYPGAHDWIDVLALEVQKTGTACTFEMTGPPLYVTLPFVVLNGLHVAAGASYGV
jgi:hypothetical protein